MTKKGHASVKEAKRLRSEGLTFAEIGKALGVTGSTAHNWLDPSFAQARRDQINRNRGSRPLRRVTSTATRTAAGAPSDTDIEKRLREIPQDTRSLTGRLFGDPLPGRAALDQTWVSIGDAASGVVDGLRARSPKP